MSSTPTLSMLLPAIQRLMGREDVGVVITPHPGEMARLLNISTEAVQHDWLRHAREFAVAHRVHVVLKGHRTIIAAPDGRTFVNLTGNAGMATGGTGDLLTGMVAAWFAQLLDAEAACKLAVYLHGTAGDLAEADEGGSCPSSLGRVASRLGDAGPRAHRAAKGQTRVVTADSLATTAEEETVAAGERFARTLAPGAVILLYGQLGAGKTAFVRGIARGLGAAGRMRSQVRPSPIIQEDKAPGRETLLSRRSLSARAGRSGRSGPGRTG